MHVLYDENGNLVPHGHNGEHCHEQDHCEQAAGGNCPAVEDPENCIHHHEHEHDHEHHHDHHHDHAHEPVRTKEQMAALLDYMLKHNQSHAAELDRMETKLLEAGMPEAAGHLRKAVDEYTKGNLYLSLALSSVKEG